MNPEDHSTSWLDRPLFTKITLNWESVLFAVILVLAFVSRFYDLGARVMSHDETSHVYFSWRLYRGEGYQHDPVTHGPLQFHLLALSYYLFGDSDFSARTPAALFGVATIAFMWAYRRYLGRAGALAAAFLLLISPYMLYYARYARNESFVALFGVITLWAMLRYLETGVQRYLYWVTAAIVFHFVTKETAYIYTAQALLFSGLFFVFRVVQNPWSDPQSRNRFMMALLVGVFLFTGAVGATMLKEGLAPISPTETAQPAVPGQPTPTPSPSQPFSPALLMGIPAALALAAAAYFLIKGYTLPRLRAERSFDLLVLIGTLVLPLLAAFPVSLFGWKPTDYSNQGILHTAAVLVPIVLIALAIGLWWNKPLWLGNAALFYAVFAVLYTTLFTNGAGFFTGMVGGLGYWLEQQGVHRGSQPWYYYLFVQIPVYEYLPALGSLLAFGLTAFKKQTLSPAGDSPQSSGAAQPAARTAVTLLGFWVITSAFAYTYAGEKMPWLTVHIAWPMILLAAWGIGYLIETTDWKVFRQRRGFLALALLPVFLISLIAWLSSLLGANPPFQGKELVQLQATNTFLIALLTSIASGWGLIYLIRSWRPQQIGRGVVLALFGLLALLTARTALTAAFINYDYANELLVYAHSGPGSKLALAQIEELSRRTTDGLAMPVAYDSDTTYPFWWYLRNYTGQRFYGSAPTRDLRDVPAILVGTKNYGKIEPVVGQAYYRFSYIRMWWPNQDYFNLTWERIWNAIRDSKMRTALFQIWFNRDYTLYGQLTGRDMSAPKWQPSDEMRLYVRKDVAAQLWNYGVGPAPEEVIADPYEGKEAKLSADIIWGSSGAAPGQFQRPRDLTVAPDGSLFVADTGNHRIQHLDRDGRVLHVWGSFADAAKGSAPGGTFNEPWGLAISPDGAFVYVADTWNHRIQKFTAQGEFVSMWGYFGQAENPEAFWGPRDVVVNAEGHVLLTDTGNKRVVVFDADGNFIAQFGSAGFGPGQFDEPVGLALDSSGRLYVADTWNQRIQTFMPDGAGGYTPITSWDIYGWFGQSLDNKPYLTVDSNGHIFAADPEGMRVLEFDSQGQIVRYWGDYGVTPATFGLTGAVAADPAGGVWVSDAGNGRIMHFNPPLP